MIQIQNLIPYLVLASHILLVILLVSVVQKNRLALWVGRNALILGFLVALGAFAGSLFYSEIVGFEACVLCWWQRAFIYPQLVIFAVALWYKDTRAFVYSFWLTIAAGIVALYQTYANLGGTSLLSCTSAEGACSKIYVMEFGYITIPTMSLTVVLYLLLLYWLNRIYVNHLR